MCPSSCLSLSPPLVNLPQQENTMPRVREDDEFAHQRHFYAKFWYAFFPRTFSWKLTSDFRAMAMLVGNVLLFRSLVVYELIDSKYKAGLTLAAIFAVQRWLSKGQRCDVQTSLRGKVAVVTGANSGIGFETAKALAQMGATVVFACRTEWKARVAMSKVRKVMAKGARLVFVQLDVADFDSVRCAAKEIETLCGGSLPLLINNAGLWDVSQRFKHLPNGHEYHMGTNFLGPMLLSELLLPCVLKASGRIINVSSVMHWAALPLYARKDSRQPLTELAVHLHKPSPSYPPIHAGLLPYALSKAAQIIYTNHLAKRLAGTGARVVSLHPGVVATNLFNKWYYRVLSSTLGPFLCFKKAEEGAQTTLFCALSGDVVNGSFYCDVEQREDLVSDYVKNAVDGESLVQWAKRELNLPS